MPNTFFDEATNSLDANERTIMEQLDKLFKQDGGGAWHRLSTVRNADNIVVLDHSKIIKQGTPHRTYGKTGYYYELVKNQLELGS